MREVPASRTSTVIPFLPATVDCLEQRQDTEECPSFIFSGVGKGGRFAWLARGGSLEVVSTSNGTRIAAWHFGTAMKDEGTSITCVSEYHYGTGTKLLVGLETGTGTGMLCVFDVKTSKVVKAIDLPQRITSVEGITTVLATEAPVQILGEHLRCFCGVVAVGTQNGYVYLIDMCLDDDTDESDEILPNQICVITNKTRDVLAKRAEAMDKGEQLALKLNEESFSRGFYNYSHPDGVLIQSFSEDEVFVSCLKFIHQIGTLIVGFNFGCYQMWKLYEPVLDYSSRFEQDMAAVTHVTYQEPENDPRNFCYIWVARGALPAESGADTSTDIQLFQLAYNRKIWYDNYGVLYEDLMSVCARLEHDLTSDRHIAMSPDDVISSRLLSCYTIENHRYQALKKPSMDDSFDEGYHGPDLSLCLFAWEISAGDGQGKPCCYIGLFDMNRWYHAQMPIEVRYSPKYNDQCSFFGIYSLESVSRTVAPDYTLAVNVEWSSVTRYLSSLFPPSEVHFFPSSLAFSACCVAETGIVHAKFLGVQRQALSDLERRGPAGMVDPSDLFNICLCAGLLAKNFDHSATNIPVAMQREALLSVALDNNLNTFISSCVTHFAYGEFMHAGCSLRFLLDWAWSKVAQLKASLDKLCVPLYDFSGVSLDPQHQQLFHHDITQLNHLVAVFQMLTGQPAVSTDQGLKDLEMKLTVVQLISQYFQAVSWFMCSGLLPENPEGVTPAAGQYAYPAVALHETYRKRRNEVKRLHKDVGETDVLLIDGLMETVGEPIKKLWNNDGGNGMYPPQSLHSLLTIYLLENVDLDTKHCIVAYMLLDLIYMMEEAPQLAEQLTKFCQAFCLRPSITRVIQGMWLLDHRDFEESLLLFLDPIVKDELLPWQHRRIIKAYLYQGENKLALKYLRIRKPPLQSPEDVKIHLTVLLANGLTAEAFEYQSANRNSNNIHDLLSHLYLACQQTKMVDQLLQLPLTDPEERHLVDYLQKSSHSSSSELLVMHYLQRARYVEAMRLNDKLKQNLMNESDPKIRERAVARNAIVDCYSRVLPGIQRKLTFSADHRPRKHMQMTRREISRPQPLSTFVNRSQTQKVVSQATLINAVLEKIQEAKQQDDEGDETPSKSNTTRISPDPGPFICTPMTPRVQTVLSEAVDVVFPQTSPPEASTSQVMVLSPTKKAFGNSPRFLRHFPTKTVDSSNRKNKYFGAEALSLLQTPPVKKRTPPKLRLSVAAPQITPQSILKVRSTVRRSASPLVDTGLGKQTNFPSSSYKYPTPPKFQKKKAVSMSISAEQTEATPKLQVTSSIKKSVSMKVSPETKSVSDSTNKQFRFGSSAKKSVRIAQETESPSDAVPKQLRFTSLMEPDGASPKELRFVGISTDEAESSTSPTSVSSPRRERHSPRLSPTMSRKATFTPDQGSEVMTEDVDEEITFNFTKSRSYVPVEPMETDTSADTLPLSSPVVEADSSHVELEIGVNSGIESDRDRHLQIVRTALQEGTADVEGILSSTSPPKTSNVSEAVSSSIDLVDLEGSQEGDKRYSEIMETDQQKEEQPSSPVTRSRSSSRRDSKSPEKNVVTQTKVKSPQRNLSSGTEDEELKTKSPVTRSRSKSPEKSTSPLTRSRSKSPEKAASPLTRSRSKSPEKATSPITRRRSKSPEKTVSPVSKSPVPVLEMPRTRSKSPEKLPGSPKSPVKQSVPSSPIVRSSGHTYSKPPVIEKEIEASPTTRSRSQSPKKSTGMSASAQRKSFLTPLTIDVPSSARKDIPSPRRSPRFSEKDDTKAEASVFKSPPRPSRVPETPPESPAGRRSPRKASPSPKPPESPGVRTRSMSESSSSPQPSPKPKVKASTRKSTRGRKQQTIKQKETESLLPTPSATPESNPTPITITPVTSRLRSAKKTTTTKSAVTPARVTRSMRKSVKSTSEDVMEFTFSSPVEIANDVIEEVDDGHLSVQQPETFIFSPPITRSRGRPAGKKTAAKQKQEAQTSSPQLTEAPVKTKAKAKPKKTVVKRNTRSSKLQSPQNPPSDSPINFISPVEPEQDSISTRTRTRVKRVPAHSTSLRTTKVETKKKKRIASVF